MEKQDSEDNHYTVTKSGIDGVQVISGLCPSCYKPDSLVWLKSIFISDTTLRIKTTCICCFESYTIYYSKGK